MINSLEAAIKRLEQPPINAKRKQLLKLIDHLLITAWSYDSLFSSIRYKDKGRPGELINDLSPEERALLTDLTADDISPEYVRVMRSNPNFWHTKVYHIPIPYCSEMS